MAGCGTSCRRLRGENGVKVEPDCCGGCVVSIDPASLPPGPGGITEQRAKEIADAAAKAAVDAYAANDPKGITEQRAKEIADAAAKAAIDEYLKNNPGITEEKAKEIADAAAKAAVDEHNAKTTDVHGIPDTSRLETQDGAQAKANAARDAAIKAADDALKAHIANHPGGEGVSEDKAREIADAAACNALAQYKSAYADNFDNLDLTSPDWVSLDPPVVQKLTVPPSRKIAVTTCMTARNTEARIQTYQAVEIALGDRVLLPPSDSRAVTLSSDLPEEASGACYTMHVDLSRLADGAAKAGDEITLTVKNRKANIPGDPGTGTSTVLDRNLSIIPLITCEGNGTPGPAPGGIDEAKAREIAFEAVCTVLAQYKSAYADNFDNIDLSNQDWAPLEPAVAVTVKVPPSKQVMVTTCFTARNTEQHIQTYQAVEIKRGDQVLLAPSDARAVTLSADLPGDPSSACHSMIVDFAKLADGVAKAGDEVTFTTTNRKANTPSDPGTGISTVLDRNISVIPLITCDGTGTPPDGGGGISEERARQIADEAAKKAVDDNNRAHPPGISEDKAKDIADAAAKAAVNDHAAKTTDVHGIPDTAALETKDGAQAKADAAEKNALDSLRALVDKCLTLQIVNDGVTAEEGWTVHTQELRSIGGTHNAVIWLKRTGENISSKTADQKAGDGQPEEGNLVPDLLIAKVAADWIPAKTILVSAHTGYTTGSVRINTKGEMYLADLTSNNALRTGQFLVFTYTFLTEPDCASAIKDPDGTPDATVKADPSDPSRRTAQLTITADSGS